MTNRSMVSHWSKQHGAWAGQHRLPAGVAVQIEVCPPEAEVACRPLQRLACSIFSGKVICKSPGPGACHPNGVSAPACRNVTDLVTKPGQFKRGIGQPALPALDVIFVARQKRWAQR